MSSFNHINQKMFYICFKAFIIERDARISLFCLTINIIFNAICYFCCQAFILINSFNVT